MRKSNVWLVSEGGYSCIISWWDRICWTALSSCLGVAARASVWPEYCLTNALGCMSSIQAGWSEEGMETFHTWCLVCKWMVDYSGIPFVWFFSISSWLGFKSSVRFGFTAPIWENRNRTGAIFSQIWVNRAPHWSELVHRCRFGAVKQFEPVLQQIGAHWCCTGANYSFIRFKAWINMQYGSINIPYWKI